MGLDFSFMSITSERAIRLMERPEQYYEAHDRLKPEGSEEEVAHLTQWIREAQTPREFEELSDQSLKYRVVFAQAFIELTGLPLMPGEFDEFSGSGWSCQEALLAFAADPKGNDPERAYLHWFADAKFATQLDEYGYLFVAPPNLVKKTARLLDSIQPENYPTAEEIAFGVVRHHHEVWDEEAKRAAIERNLELGHEILKRADEHRDMQRFMRKHADLGHCLIYSYSC